MAKESEVVREIHSLDSDMQTLVYENYNKFISATDTINKMRVDFRETVSRSYQDQFVKTRFPRIWSKMS